LGRAADHADWRRRPVGVVPALPDVDPVAARAVIDRALAAHDDAWLAPEDGVAVCRAFGIPVAPVRRAASAAEAAEAADAIGYPVAVKAGAPELVHKTDAGGVRLGLTTPDAVRAAFSDMDAALGDALGGVVVQPMVEAGIETIVGVTQDPNFGPLVLFGMGGIAAELVRDTALRLVPVTDVDAAELVRALRSSPILFGYRGTPAADVGALEDLLVRVGRLADDIPEVRELDCNPVLVGPSGVVTVDVKVRVARVPATPSASLRRLRRA
jgi:acyl-CoA synthetase (NDP forming)